MLEMMKTLSSVFDDEPLPVENPALTHKDLPFREQMKAQLSAATARRRSLPGGLEAVASERDNI